METVVARKTWRTAEPVHALLYFAPEAGEACEAIGVPTGRANYFALRASPLGAVPAEVVIATFFNFHPALVRSAIPAAWSAASPAQFVEARFAGAAAALRRALGELADGPHIEEAATLARRAADAASERPEGRPLFAAHAALAWPDDPLLVLWHAQTLLREFRGDGHIAAMTADDVDGVEALIIHGATGEVAPSVLQTTRAWPDDEWAAGEDRLRSRRWLAPDGSLTTAGREHREGVEQRTDELALDAYRPLGPDGCDRLRELTRPLSKAIVASGTFGFPAA